MNLTLKTVSDLRLVVFPDTFAMHQLGLHDSPVAFQRLWLASKDEPTPEPTPEGWAKIIGPMVLCHLVMHPDEPMMAPRLRGEGVPKEGQVIRADAYEQSEAIASDRKTGLARQIQYLTIITWEVIQ